MPNKDSMRCIT